MKTISRIAIGAAVALLVAATLQPVEAACATPRLLDNVGAFLVSNPDWGGAGGDRSCTYGYGCYADDAGGGLQNPPISGDFDGAFWGFETAGGGSQSDPAIGLGMDNGGWGIENWSKQVTAVFAQPYHYPAFLTLPGGENGTAGNPANWSFPVDGCPNDIDPNACTCILLTDQWNNVGYFFVDSANADAIGNFPFRGFPGDPAGDPAMVLAPIPAPQVTGSVRDAATGDVTIQVNAGTLGGADFRDPGCDCGMSYLVYQQLVARDGAAPGDRNITRGGWTLAQSPTGAQSPTPIGQQAEVLVDCDPAVPNDVYLATALADSNGLVTVNLSSNSFRIECGAQLADPSRPDRGGDRGRSADAPRGRDNNRGQRDR